MSIQEYLGVVPRLPPRVTHTQASPAGRLGWTLLAALTMGCQAQDPLAGLPRPKDSPYQAQWFATQQPPALSPAQAATGDLVSAWRGPSGQNTRVVVRQPLEDAKRPVVAVRAPRAGEDAGPLLQAALDAAKQAGARRIVLEGTRYTVHPNAKRSTHLLLEGVSDLTLDGRGATVLFAGPGDGLRIRESARVRLLQLTLGYTTRCSSLAETRRDGERTVLHVDTRHPVSAQTPLHQVTEYDRVNKRWVPGGRRIILLPDSATPARLIAPQTYHSETFNRLPVGRTFALFHSWYQGAVIRIEDEPGPKQSQDITLERVTIASGPGMGVLAYGLKRGLALIDSRVQADDALTGNPLSTNYDALHVLISGGDTLIQRNRFADHGDDAINLSTPQSPIVSVDEAGSRLTLSKYSRFLRPGQAVTLVNPNGQVMGNTTVARSPEPRGGLLYQVVVMPALPEAQMGWVIRPLALQGGRFDISDNRFERFNGHAVLAQQGRGRVHHNEVESINRNAVRLLADTGRWNEGAGAIDVAVTDNRFVDTAIDEIPSVPWSVITAYGGGKGGLVDGLVNADLLIAGNTVRGAQQGCITVANSLRATVTGNLCIDTNLRHPGEPSIRIERSSEVVVKGNARQGSSTGGVSARENHSTRIEAD